MIPHWFSNTDCEICNFHTKAYCIFAVMEQKTLDLAYLHSISNGDIEFEKSLCQLFADQLQQMADEMQEALSQSDWIRLAIAAHTAKSSVASMGMSKMAFNLKRLEMSCKAYYVKCCRLKGGTDPKLEWYENQISSLPAELKHMVEKDTEKVVANVVTDILKIYKLHADRALKELEEAQLINLKSEDHDRS